MNREGENYVILSKLMPVAKAKKNKRNQLTEICNVCRIKFKEISVSLTPIHNFAIRNSKTIQNVCKICFFLTKIFVSLKNFNFKINYNLFYDSRWFWLKY